MVERRKKELNLKLRTPHERQFHQGNGHAFTKDAAAKGKARSCQRKKLSWCFPRGRGGRGLKGRKSNGKHGIFGFRSERFLQGRLPKNDEFEHLKQEPEPETDFKFGKPETFAQARCIIFIL
ncbi:hypothetical protein RUM44_008038 [Polyplax serrata]|uniref:Uncharacterized protein n=1 Tax=Polyplax serrata TaxID=468196 RepID=A0ABR1BB78_POLSC